MPKTILSGVSRPTEGIGAFANRSESEYLLMARGNSIERRAAAFYGSDDIKGLFIRSPVDRDPDDRVVAAAARTARNVTIMDDCWQTGVPEIMAGVLHNKNRIIQFVIAGMKHSNPEIRELATEIHAEEMRSRMRRADDLQPLREQREQRYRNPESRVA